MLLTGLLVPVSAFAAADVSSDSCEVSQMLAQAKAEATELKTDSADMEAFTRSGNVSWAVYAEHLNLIKEHVNALGRLVKQINDIEVLCSPWQATALERTTAALKELADNVNSTIEHLNANQSRVHMPAFQDYVKANYELVSDLAAVISDFVDYGNAKEKMERLEQILEISS